MCSKTLLNMHVQLFSEIKAQSINLRNLNSKRFEETALMLQYKPFAFNVFYAVLNIAKLRYLRDACLFTGCFIKEFI